MKKLFSILIICFLFSSCKKYPENNLWFKNPTKTLAKGSNDAWIMEYYSVNGVDSTNSSFLSVYEREGLNIYLDGGHQFYSSLDILSGSWEFTNHKKDISFKFTQYSFLKNSYQNSTYQNQRNVFLESGQSWKISKLTETQFWIITEYNNNKYEIHFK